MAKGGSAPQTDPRIAEAGLTQAKLGEDYLKFMKGQAQRTNTWATQDRAYANTVFRPMERQMAKDAQGYASPTRMNNRAQEATAAVTREATLANDAEGRSLAASGVAPGSGRSLAASQRRSLATALGRAGAATTARKDVEAEGYARKADAINIGRGYAVNPGTALSLSNGAASSGAATAMNGQQGLASTLSTVKGQEWDAYNAKQQQSSSMMQGVGMLAGAFLSTEKVKTKHGPAGARSLKAVRDMEIDKWTYDAGAGDGGTHVGPYAEGFKKATGLGNGRSINIIDAVGTSLGATKELDKSVQKLTKQVATLTKGKGRSLADAGV